MACWRVCLEHLELVAFLTSDPIIRLTVRAIFYLDAIGERSEWSRSRSRNRKRIRYAANGGHKTRSRRKIREARAPLLMAHSISSPVAVVVAPPPACSRSRSCYCCCCWSHSGLVLWRIIGGESSSVFVGLVVCVFGLVAGVSSDRRRKRRLTISPFASRSHKSNTSAARAMATQLVAGSWIRRLALGALRLRRLRASRRLLAVWLAGCRHEPHNRPKWLLASLGRASDRREEAQGESSE